MQAQIVELLRRLQQRHHIACLFISHDLRVVRAMSHRVIVLKDGRVVEEGPAAELFARPRDAVNRCSEHVGASEPQLAAVTRAAASAPGRRARCRSQPTT